MSGFERHLMNRWVSSKGSTTMGGKKSGRNRKAEADTPNPVADAATAAGTANTDAWSDAWRTVALALTTGTAFDTDERAREGQLEVVESDMPILAHREALLRFAGDGKHWQPLHQGMPFGVDTHARCHANMGKISLYWGSLGSGSGVSAHPDTPAPAVDCSCGFYAMPLGKPAYTTSSSYVRLLVELSGDVIECEQMYRAGHQRVIECQVPPCKYCDRPSQVLSVEGDLMMQAGCRLTHLANPGGIIVSLDDLRNLLPVPVTTRGSDW